MEEKEKQIPDLDFINEQRVDAKLLNRIKVDPKNIVIQGLRYDDIEQENKETTQKGGNGNDIEETANTIAKNSLQMRLKVLNMELNRVKAFILKELIKNDYEVSKYIDNIEKYTHKVQPAIDPSHFENAKDEFFIAKDLNARLMKQIYTAVKSIAAQKEMKKPKHEVKVPEYRSIVTVRGTEEDVLNCTLKATVAIENDNYDRAERLLLKAERMFPTKNARDLLMQVRTNKAIKLTRELTENATKAVEQVYTVNEHTEKTRIPELSCVDDEKQKEIKTQIKTQSKGVIKTEVTKLEKGDEPEISKTFDYQEGSLEKNKDIMNEKVKSDANLKVLEPPPVTKQIKKSKSMVKKPIHDVKVYDAMKIENTGQELYPNARSKDQLGTEDKKDTSNVIKSHVENKSIKQAKTFSSNGEVEKLNCYKLPIESNESDRSNALQCIEVAQVAFQKGQYDKAERFLLKSLKISESQEAKSMLETVLNAKANNTYTINIDKKYNEPVNDKSQNKNLNEHSLKFTPINPNDDPRKQHNQDVGASQPSSDKENTSKTVNSDNDFQRDKEADAFLSLAIDAKNEHRIVATRHYLKRASERELSEKTRELLQNIKMDVGSGRDSLSRKETEFEAKRLLVKVHDLINIGDLANAEFVLTVSWNMHRSLNRSIIMCHKKFLKARMALFQKEKEDCSDGRNDGISENIFICDTLVESALVKYENDKLEEAEELLKKASALHPCVRINQLLDGIQELQNTLFRKLKRSNFYTK